MWHEMRLKLPMVAYHHSRPAIPVICRRNTPPSHHYLITFVCELEIGMERRICFQVVRDDCREQCSKKTNTAHVAMPYSEEYSSWS